MSVRYKKGTDPWMEIHKENIDGCEILWRYSLPEKCDEPQFKGKDNEIHQFDNYLKQFDELLAKIQTEFHMQRYIMSKKATLSNEEMILLEWLHKKVRNEYEHFVPKTYLVGKIGLIQASQLALEIAEWLIFSSGNCIEHTNNKYLNTKFHTIHEKLSEFNIV